MEERNLDLSIKSLQGELEKLLAGKFGMDMLIITRVFVVIIKILNK